MSITALVGLILASVPAGVQALDAIVNYVKVLETDAERRAFLIGCTAMCRAILLANPTLTPSDSQRWCVDAVRYYAINMGQPVDDVVLRSLGLVWTEGTP